MRGNRGNLNQGRTGLPAPVLRNFSSTRNFSIKKKRGGGRRKKKEHMEKRKKKGDKRTPNHKAKEQQIDHEEDFRYHFLCGAVRAMKRREML